MPLIPRSIEEPKSYRGDADDPLHPSQSSALKMIISQSHRFRGFAVFSRHQFDLAAVRLDVGHAACNLFLDDRLVAGNQRQNPAEFREYRNLRLDKVAFICGDRLDRKSTRLNSSHRCISYAVFCLKKKKKKKQIK